MVALSLKSSSANDTWNVEGEKEKESSENREGEGESPDLRRK